MEKQCCFCSFQLKIEILISLCLVFDSHTLLVGNRNWKPLEQSAIGWLVWQDEGDVAGCLLSPFTFKVFCFPAYPNSHYLNIHCRMSAVRALKTLKLGISAQFCCFYYLWGEKEKTRGKFGSYIWPVKEIDAVLLFPSELMERVKLSFFVSCSWVFLHLFKVYELVFASAGRRTETEKVIWVGSPVIGIKEGKNNWVKMQAVLCTCCWLCADSSADFFSFSCLEINALIFETESTDRIISSEGCANWC